MDCYKKLLLPALVISSIAINLYFRLDTLFLPLCDRIATQEAHSRLLKELRNGISLSDPGIADGLKEKLSGALFKTYLGEKKEEVKSAIYRRSKELKEYFRDNRGYTYFFETDSYRWQRRIENFLTTGHFGTARINNLEYDNLMFAPFGAKVDAIKLNFYIGAYFYKVLHLINNNLTLSEALSFLPLLLSAGMIVCVFWISILFGVSYWGGFLSSLAVGLSGMILQRSCFGWFDTDLYHIIFAILLIIILSLSFKAGFPKNYLYLVLSGFLVGAHSALWPIWWLPFYITVAGLFLYKLESVVYDRDKRFIERLKSSCLEIFIFVLSAYLSVMIISGFDVFINSFIGPGSFVSLRGKAALNDFWPDIAFTISELKRFEMRDLLKASGGGLVVYSGVFGILLLFIFRKKIACRKERRFLRIMLFIWMISAFFLTSFGNRFVIFLAIFLSVSFGALWDFIAESVFSAKAFKKTRIVLLPCLFLIVTFCLVNGKSLRILPRMNDSWWNMMLKVKEATPEDAVIVARWDISDYIMTIAKRPTLDDASWQYTPAPYWINRALLSRNQDEALGILRMLNSGGNKAFDELSKNLGDDKQKAMEIINQMLLLSKDDSLALLSRNIKDRNEIDKISDYMYSSSRPVYLIVDNHMSDLVAENSIIANWDFKRLDLWLKSRKLKEAEFMNYAREKSGYPEEDARGLFYRLKFIGREEASDWISPLSYKIYTSPARQELQGEAKRIFFSNGIAVDLENMKFYFSDTGSGKWIAPGRLIFFDKNKNEIKEYNDSGADASLCLLLTKEANTYDCILLSSILSETLFFKLYYLKGLRQDYFQFIHHEAKEGFDNIFLYKVNWEKQNKGDLI